MILTKLKLENFKKYKSYEIEFTQGLVGIIGKNGSGKSTIFEAILFALYGEAKKRGNKELLRNATSSTKDAVVVELEFEFEDALYKVVREFRGKTLSANAKLYKNNTLTTTGAKEVTMAIVKLTSMSKDAFLHTLFASQKELTSLSNLKNEDRKKMIRKLLGLEKIDFIEKELIEKARELSRDIKSFSEVLLSDEDMKEKNKDIAKNIDEKNRLTKDGDSKKDELDALKKSEAVLKTKLELFAKTKDAKQKAKASMELTLNSLKLENLNKTKLLDEQEKLNEKQKIFDAKKDIKQEYEKLTTKLNEMQNLKEMHLKTQTLIHEQESLKELYTKYTDEIKALVVECKMLPVHNDNILKLEKELQNLTINIEKKQSLQKGLESSISGVKSIINDTDKKIKNIKKLGKDSPCPTCTRVLLDEYDNVINSLEHIIQNEYKTKIQTFEGELKVLIDAKDILTSTHTQKLQEYQELSYEIKLLKNKQEDIKKVEIELENVKQKSIKNNSELDKLKEFTYDESKHKEIKKSYDEMGVKYRELIELESELKRFDIVKKEITDITTKIDELSKNLTLRESEFEKLIYDETTHKLKLNTYEQIQKDIEKKNQHINQIMVQIAQIDGEIKSIKNILNVNEKHLKSLQTKKDHLNDYEKIKTSLSIFKTKLNQKIAPRISSIASSMFAQITKGKYQHIEVNNHFDFFIYDDAKRYPIERFSGGEIDLANLVLRIAISKTLTELSGTSSVGFLAFDEVFGSQDENRRMQILEVFQTLKEQYRQIFLISHEMEIKEMFESVVEL